MIFSTVKKLYVIRVQGHIIAYAMCVLGGPTPLWGVWSKGGEFIRFYGRKDAWEKDYARASISAGNIVCESKENPDMLSFDTATTYLKDRLRHKDVGVHAPHIA